ncbi:MAG: PhzF family phenazine biosynthesis protein [Bacillaceae bacterium]|nr:PhzF family phenazine biosynthesis protein [Bacillaceae bacterium]
MAEVSGHGTQEAGSAIQFHTKSGVLKADKQEGKIKLTFRVKESVPVSVTEDLKQVTDAPIISAAWAEDRYILELENENAVRQANPDLQAVQNLEGTGVILTSRGTTGSRYDFISRYFAPKIGIDEDQVTGSAHCALASYWNQKLNQTEFLAYQASKRGGELTVELLEEKVIIGGDCLTLMRGKLAD